ncbi:hypothetical protein BVRB_4g094230 [Beta vulgaris subsp. vulgaris]|nr:hypothetical protein BVRB_4g094230 [Beta vulgaris subsp. vulgaris]
MAKKRKEPSPSEDNLASDPEDEASDAEKIRRENERGRTVLAKVGKAIQDGTKIPVEWHPTHKVPVGENRTPLSTYIGVMVRERVGLNYRKWSDVPKELKNEVQGLDGGQFGGSNGQGLGTGAQFGGLGNAPFHSFTRLLCGNGGEGSSGAVLSGFNGGLGGSCGNSSQHSGQNGGFDGHEFRGTKSSNFSGLDKGDVHLNVHSEPLHEVIKPYHVAWPEQSHPHHDQLRKKNFDIKPHKDHEPNVNNYIFPKAEYPLSLQVTVAAFLVLLPPSSCHVSDMSLV